MGLAQGSISTTRYRVIGLKQNFKPGSHDEHFQTYTAKKIRMGNSQPLKFGWVCPAHLNFGGEEQFELNDCLVNSKLLLRFRVEQKRIPAPLLKLFSLERINQREARRSNPLSAKEKRELVKELKAELITSVLPNLSYVEAAWWLDEGFIDLYSTSKRQIALFDELFYKSFGDPLELTLVRSNALISGIELKELEAPEKAAAKMKRLIDLHPKVSQPSA